MVWCPFCERYIIGAPLSNEREEHFSAHMAEAAQNIQEYGYTGVVLGAGEQRLGPLNVSSASTTKHLSSRLDAPKCLGFGDLRRHQTCTNAPQEVCGKGLGSMSSLEKR